MKINTHIKSLLTFWKSSVSRRMTFYFTIFGIVIFYATASLYMMAFRQSFITSITNILQEHFKQLDDINDSDFLWHSVNQHRPDIYGILSTLINIYPELISHDDISIYCRVKKNHMWYRIYFKSDQIIYAEQTNDAILKKLNRKLRYPLVLSNFHFFITKETLSLFNNITGENDVNNYFLKLTMHREGMGGVLRTFGIHIGIITLILLVLTRVLGYFFARKFAGPIETLSRGVTSIANGNLDTSIPVNSNDEIGTLANNLNLMVEGLKERDFIKETFGKYVTKEIRDEILKGRIPLDGELKWVTVLFADLRDFTPLSETMSPDKMAKMLNGYFKEMSDAIHLQNGLVLQFLGDEIEAVFGAPLHMKDHAQCAVNAAIEMRKRLALFNDEMQHQGFTPLQHGIGIHTGQVLAANIGSPDRLSYTLIGDTVNMASRIQELNKDFGTDILISATTRTDLSDTQNLEELKETPIRGKSDPMALYKVL